MLCVPWIMDIEATLGVKDSELIHMGRVIWVFCSQDLDFTAPGIGSQSFADSE
jgi:hypothetical protein